MIAQPQARIGIGEEGGIKHSGIISTRISTRDRETASEKNRKKSEKKSSSRAELDCVAHDLHVVN